jgi:hypothetical protein
MKKLKGRMGRRSREVKDRKMECGRRKGDGE